MQNSSVPETMLPEMPNDLGAECSVLGAILIDPETLEYTESLVPEAFTMPAIKSFSDAL